MMSNVVVSMVGSFSGFAAPTPADLMAGVEAIRCKRFRAGHVMDSDICRAVRAFTEMPAA